MATTADVKNNLATRPAEQTKDLKTLIQEAGKELGQALPAHLNPERMVRIALTAIRLNPELAQCTPESFIGSLFVLAQVGLEPIAGRAYLLPFNNNRKVGFQNGKPVFHRFKDVQAVIGYKGLADLFYRHESALALDMQTVHENDEFDYQYGTESYLHHRPAKGNRGQSIGYYAVAKMKAGGVVFRYMSREEVLEHAKQHSKTWDQEKQQFNPRTPWATDFDAMAMKTVLIQLSKLLPLSIELQQAISVDETSREYRKGVNSALDLRDTTSWDAAIDITPEEPGPAASGLSPIAKKGNISQDTFDLIMKARAKVGDQDFFKVLGIEGYETIEQIPNEEKAKAFLEELRKVWEAKQQR